MRSFVKTMAVFVSMLFYLYAYIDTWYIYICIKVHLCRRPSNSLCEHAMPRVSYETCSSLAQHGSPVGSCGFSVQDMIQPYPPRMTSVNATAGNFRWAPQWCLLSGNWFELCQSGRGSIPCSAPVAGSSAPLLWGLWKPRWMAGWECLVTLWSMFFFF